MEMPTYDASFSKDVDGDDIELRFKINLKRVPTPTVEYVQGTSLWHVQCKYVLEVLRRNDGSRTKSAKELRICAKTLKNYIDTMKVEGIDVPKVRYCGKGKRGRREITIDTW